MVNKTPSVKIVFKNLAERISRNFLRPAKSFGGRKNKKKVLMFGWELPPFNSGGLGVACYEMANSISKLNNEVTFVLPHHRDLKAPFMKVVFAQPDNLKVVQIDAAISPYLSANEYKKKAKSKRHANTLISEVERYGREAGKIIQREKFDIIHAHDWLSFPAGVKAKETSGKPLVVHVHALEYDRCHEAGVDPEICAIEKDGLEKADKVIAISHYIKERIIKYYNIPAAKIAVVHNGIRITNRPKAVPLNFLKKGGKKMVLFVGRITYQKGADYLIKAAAKVTKYNPLVSFMVVGSGDMEYQLMNEAASLGISDKIFFPGFLRDQNLEKIYRTADVFVMPSVSEPFGLVALEASANHVPVILSRQSGAAEVIKNSLKVDFWNTDELANLILTVLKNKALKNELSKNGFSDAKRCTWEVTAKKCLSVYDNLLIIPRSHA